MLISALKKGSTKVIGRHDPDSKPFVGIVFRPDAWAANTVYELPYDFSPDTVMPTVYKGLYFRVKYPGKSGATDPFTGTYKAGDEITDGTVTWEAVNYNLMPIGVTVSSVVITPTNDVTISGQVTGDNYTQFFIDPITTDIDSFELTFTITYSNGVIIDRTLKYLVAEQ